MFSCEFCEIPKNTFFIEHLRMTESQKITHQPTPDSQYNMIINSKVGFKKSVLL